jgi:lipoprotein-releasing system permease protein
MSTSSFIAKRYLFSRTHISLISTLTYISIAGVTIGTALLIVVLSVFNGFFDVVKSLLLSFDPDIRIESNEGSTFKFTDEIKQQLSDIPEITNLSAFVVGKALLTSEEGEIKVVEVKGIEEDRFIDMVNIEGAIRSGVFDLEVRNRKPGIVIHEQLRSDLYLSLNDEVALLSAAGMRKALTQITVPRSYRFDLRGAYLVQSIASTPSVYIEIDAARRLFKARNTVSGIDLKLKNNKNAESVKILLESKFGSQFKISTWYDLQKPLYDVMYLEKWGAYVILMIIVLVAALNIIGSLTMIVIQKKRDIGILMAMGYSNKKIKLIFRKQGLFIGLIGCGIGGSLGFLMCWLQQKFGLIKLSSAFIINAYPVDMQLFDISVILFGSLMLCLTASWFPANRAAQVQPAEATRFE